MKKRIITLQDLSLFGRCSLTVALPVITALGIECVPLPSMILSTHTGGLGEPVRTDLESIINPTIEHFDKIKVNFDGIYLGYIGSGSKIEAAKNLIRVFKHKDNFVLVDPAMADHGKLYSGFDTEYVEKIKELSKLSDFITPNLTEACMLSGHSYQGESPDDEILRSMLDKLSNLYETGVIITGIAKNICGKEYVGAAYKEVDGNPEMGNFLERVKGPFHGIGDLFASVVSSRLVTGKDLKNSVADATAITRLAAEITLKKGEDPRYGLDIEGLVSELISGYRK
ncbi:MAG: hypothetical protein GX928_02215 [Ruminococcaceae bacterium]|nr:hypothetical protein [Oscillospiraceae bacterium]